MFSLNPTFIFVLLAWMNKCNCSRFQAFGPSAHHSEIENHTIGSIPTVGHFPIKHPACSPGSQKAFIAHDMLHLVAHPLGAFIVGTVSHSYHYSWLI